MVACTNVLVGLPPHIQQTMLWNITRDLPKQSMVLINDYSDDHVKPMQAKYGGWMSDEILETQFHVRATVLNEPIIRDYCDILLTKF